jgi:DNA-binding Xre family transcriptional regulator
MASNVIFEARFSDCDTLNHAEKLADYHAEVLKVAQSLPMTFSGALDQLIEWSDMTIEALAEASEISEKTIQRLRYNEPDNVSIESVVQLCIGMQLEPMLSDYLLKASGKSLMMTAQHTMYYFLLHSYYTHSIYECNDMLADQNLKLLGRKNRGIEAVI